MGVREMLVGFEDNMWKKCTVTLTAECGLKNGAELFVENCRRITSCDEDYIILSVYGMDIRVVGAPLELSNFGVGSVKITGKIHSLTFEENCNE